MPRILFVVLALWVGTGIARGQDANLVSLNDQLAPYLKKHKIPAVAAAVVKDGKIIAEGAVGTRRAGFDLPVTLDDRFHLGSDTKAMTALLAGMLVDEGKLRWDSTVAEVFPELERDIHADVRGVTLEQLLSHISGFPGDNEKFMELLLQATQQPGNLDEARYWMVKEWVKLPLVAKPGEKFAYSNMGYVFVGAMQEKVTGRTWDELITERLFEPLKLKTAGLGCQASAGKIDAPLGHQLVDGQLKALLAGPNGDNPIVLGPAGIAHMSIRNFATWGGWNAGQGRRGPKLVQPETQKELHSMVISMSDRKDAAPGTPASGRYGHGWGEMQPEWAPRPLLLHAGSNTLNLAKIWLDIPADFAMVVTINVSNPEVAQVVDEIGGKLYVQFAKSK